MTGISKLEEQANTAEQIWSLLQAGEMVEAHGLMPWSSNYTFLVTLGNDQDQILAVYKPCRGERPLWDFPHGSLALRELAAFHVCQALGWGFIPPTVLRDGIYGTGAVQLLVAADLESHYFTLRDEHTAVFQQIAAFDLVVNNADRKAGHCLRDERGQIWGVDHGLTFHVEDKLRTVIWDFAGQTIPDNIMQSLTGLAQELSGASKLEEQLGRLLSVEEIEQFSQRLNLLLASGCFPQPTNRRCVPYPPV